MAPRGGTVVLLLILAHAALAMMPGHASKYGFPTPPPQFRDMAKILMMKCLQMGHGVPTMMHMQNPFNNSDTDSDTDMDSYLHFHSNRSMELPDSNDWNMNHTSLPSLIKLTRNSSDATMGCLKQGFIAPLAWAVLISGDKMDPEDLADVVWAAKPYLQYMPPFKLNLPLRIQRTHMAKMMGMLREVFGSLSEDQRVQIKEWVKEWVTQNYFNCTLSVRKPRPKPTGLKPVQNQKPSSPGKDSPENDPQVQPPVISNRCSPKVMWLKMEEMTIMGPFLSLLGTDDVKRIAKDQLCRFFFSPSFSTSFRVVRVKPFLARRLLRMLNKCLKSKEEFSQYVDRLGALACYYDDAPPMNMDLSKRFLSQLDNCSNSGVIKLRRRLVGTLMLSSKEAASPVLLKELGAGMTELSPAQLSKFPISALKDALRALRPGVKMHPAMARKLVKKLMQGKKMSGDDLIDLGPAISGVLTSVLTKVNLQRLLGRQVLRDVTERMSKAQRRALLEGLTGVSASELVQKVPDALLRMLSLATLEKANLSLDELGDRQWSHAQSAFLVRKIMGGNRIWPRDIRKLGGPAIRGLTCKMIDRIADDDAKAMAQTLTDTSQWLSKVQVGCAARKLFASLEKERPGYFRNISKVDLDDIPTLLLIHLPPGKIRHLPDSVCPTFLDKMSEANLNSLPRRALQRLMLVSRALHCLAQGRNISELSNEEVLSMGPLLCELPPSQLSLMSPEALTSSLQAMALCTQIPPRHRGALIQLLNKTYGDPSDWSAETMESLGPLLLLDAAAIRALHYKSWLKGVLSDLLDSLPRPPVPPPPKELQTGVDLYALKEKLFNLIVSSSGSTSTDAHRKREAEEVEVDKVPTVSLIKDLGKENVYFTPQQLDKMSAKTFSDAVETLADVTDYSSEQLRVLRKKAVEAWGAVQHLNESQVIQLGCVSQGFTNIELEKVPISSLDTLETLADCGWTQEQREAVWKGFMERKGVSVGELGAVEITQLNQFICGFRPEEIEQVSTDAFREAVDSVGDVQCPLVVTEKLKDRAVAVFGLPNNWTEAVVITLGNIVAGLSAGELTSLDPSVFSFFKPTSIPLIPADHLAVLSVGQLEALGPDNAAMLTDAQRKGLGREELDALERALVGARDPVTITTPQIQVTLSGEPTLSAEGITASVEPVLFLLLVLFLL